MILVSHRTPRTAALCSDRAAAGANVFEVDVQLSESGIVVSHFLPVLGINGWLEHDNWKLRWRAGRTHDLWLTQTLALIPNDCNVLIDPKETASPRQRQLTDRLIASIDDPDRFIVSTKSLTELDRFRDSGFRTWRTIRNRDDLCQAFEDRRLDHPGVSIRHSLLSLESMQRLSEDVGTVVAWTVNDEDRAQQLVRLGVAGITTDNPAILNAFGPEVDG